MESNNTNPNDVPIAHLCNNKACKGTLKPYPRLFCSLCQDGTDCSTNDLVREVNSLRKTAEVNRARDLAWLDFDLQFAFDVADGQDEDEAFDKMLQERTHLDLMGSIKFLYKERKKCLADARYSEMRHNACSWLGVFNNLKSLE
jgi:hypothetical protein